MLILTTQTGIVSVYLLYGEETTQFDPDGKSIFTCFQIHNIYIFHYFDVLRPKYDGTILTLYEVFPVSSTYNYTYKNLFLNYKSPEQFVQTICGFHGVEGLKKMHNPILFLLDSWEILFFCLPTYSWK